MHLRRGVVLYSIPLTGDSIFDLTDNGHLFVSFLSLLALSLSFSSFGGGGVGLGPLCFPVLFVLLRFVTLEE